MLKDVGLETESFDGDALRGRFPYLDADMARLDVDAGVVDLPAVTRTLTRVLAERGVQTVEGVETTAIVRDGDALRVRHRRRRVRDALARRDRGPRHQRAARPAAGLRAAGPADQGPAERGQVLHPAATRERFTAGAMPVIAYLDAGIYCHPIVEGLVDAVKIGYYNPPDMPRGTTSIDSIASFIEQCMPGLADAAVRDVEDVDQCDYDLVADDDFVLGAIPGVANAFVGVGWRGTGYKFAPWVGRVLADLALADGTQYDIDRFDPARFEEGGSR